MVKYFLDTYALIELIKGNPKFVSYIDKDTVTSLFNLYEFYVYLLKNESEDVAKEYYYEFKRMCVEITDKHIFLSGKFKLANIKTNISYVDSLGYVFAKEEGMKFVTGDKEFKNMENVEFIQ